MSGKTAVLLLTLTAFLGFAPYARGDDLAPGKTTRRTSAKKGSLHLFAFGKGKPTDPIQMQKLAGVSLRRVTDAARSTAPGIKIEALAEAPMTKEQYLSGERKEELNGQLFKKRLRLLAAKISKHDTVIIYTHTHGRRAGFEGVQPLGGIVVDLPIRRTEHRGTLLWSDYAELLLKIPAKNLIVLTMSCFSGGLVEYLNGPTVKPRWQKRRKQGRNFIVLSSQNSALASSPICRDGAVINPFTYAVAEMLGGAADGFKRTRRKRGTKDGHLSFGELVDFVLHRTATVKSERDRMKNTAKPQATGSYDRAAILSFGGRSRP